MTEIVLRNVSVGVLELCLSLAYTGRLDIFASNKDSEITVAPHLSADLM